MRKVFRILSLILIIITVLLCATSCNQADNVVYSLQQDSDAFNVYRRVTFINLRTDKVLLEVEGFVSIKDSGTNEIAVIVETGKNEYKMHYLYVGGEVVYLVEQIENESENPYSWKLHIFAEYPTITID